MSSAPRETIPSISPTFSPASSMARRMACSSRYSESFPVRPRSLVAVPTIAYLSRTAQPLRFQPWEDLVVVPVHFVAVVRARHPDAGKADVADQRQLLGDLIRAPDTRDPAAGRGVAAAQFVALLGRLHVLQAAAHAQHVV